MRKSLPYILSLSHKNKINIACQKLGSLGLQYFVMYIVFNDGSRFVLSNVYHLLIPYYTDEFYKEDFSFDHNVICNKDHYLCDETMSVSSDFKIALEERFNIHRAYYIIRPSTECTFVFGAIKGKKFENHLNFFNSTVHLFEDFCINFVDSTLDIIKDNNPRFKRSFILNNSKLR